ncbi:MAG: trypsin-like peptidase domain-containing protein [Ignavibacteriales bacterium]
MIHIDPYSVCTCLIQIIGEGHRLGTATGFFWKAGTQTFLVSNWHVFSGREPRTGQPKSKTYLVPSALQVHFHIRPDPNRTVQLTAPLQQADRKVLWYQHSTHGQKVDVAVLDLTALLSQVSGESGQTIEPFFVNQLPQVNDMLLVMGSDIFILGYPLGIAKTGIFPVWKRGSIATEWEVNVEGLPCFLVDTATREGISGSPVIARAFGSYMTTDGSQAFSGVVNMFLGVYSGRYVGGIDEAQLGIIWKKQLLEEIIAQPAPGDFQLFKDG